MASDEQSIRDFVANRNAAKALFTAGPASLLVENIVGLRPCFGRGDPDYEQVEESVLTMLKKMTGHRHLARIQGSASLAMEIMAMNYLCGTVLIVETGYYSDRLRTLAESAQRRGDQITSVHSVSWRDLHTVEIHYDWIWACSTETSAGLQLPTTELRSHAERLSARLMLDATASIGLESGHELADVIGYSSCKGLFGLTGACFVASHELPSQPVDSFYLDLNNHLEKKMTGPYHAVASLLEVLPRHDEFKSAVLENKNRFMKTMRSYLTVPQQNQPAICTHVNYDIRAAVPEAILYRPRALKSGSIVCHLGEAHLGRRARGDLLRKLCLPSEDT